MPELPEVETMRRDLEQFAQGIRIKHIHINDKRVLRNVSTKQFIRQLKGQSFISFQRRGKALMIGLSNGCYLVAQPMMTGHFLYTHEKPSINSETKFVFTLCNGSYLIYNDHRCFGRIFIVRDLKEVAFLKTIGPEPFEKDFSESYIKDKLSRRSIPIKNVLLDQKFVAGIGNIYASEALFDAGIHPERKANRLTKKECIRLKEEIQTILKQAIQLRGTSMRNYRDASGQTGKFMNRIKVYGKKNEPCPQCGEGIQKIVQAARSTFFCQSCQR